MLIKFLNSFRVLSLALLCSTAFGQNSPNERAVQKNAETIVNQYVSRLKASGFKPPFVPRVIIENTPQLISYDKADRRITIPAWDGLNADEKKLFDEWAGFAGGGETGRTLFEELFNWFFIPHELSHYFAGELNSSGNVDNFESEKSANEFAVAFWLTQPGVKSRLDRIARTARNIQQALPNPVPPGQDAKRYFNEHYDELGRNPPAYGYYQLKFVSDALAARKRLKFDSMVRAAMKKPNG